MTCLMSALYYKMEKRGVSEVPVDVEAGRVHGHGPWTWFF